MVPKESGFNQSVAASGMCARKNCTERLHVDATIIRSFQKELF